MEENNPSAEHQQEKFLDISLEYDESTRVLSAVLSETETCPNLNYQSLNTLFAEEAYAPFKVGAPKIQELLKTIQQGDPMVMELAVKPEYTQMSLEYDESTRVLSANLSASEEDLGLNLMKIQQLIQEGGFQEYGICNVNVQNVAKKIASNERGLFPIGKKPEYTDVKLIFDPQTNELHANLSSSEVNLEFTVEKISEMINEMGYQVFYFEEGVLVKLAENIQKNTRGNVHLATKKDASMTIEFKNEHMEAYLTMTPAYGGSNLSMDTLKQNILDERIQWDLCDISVLEAAIEQQVAQDLLFAKGIAPVNGDDSYFEPLVKAIVQRGPRIDEKDRAHLRDIKEFTIVDEGTHLMRRIPATLGTEGINVLGLKLEPEPGVDIPFEDELLGAKICEEDKNVLVSTVKGAPIVTERGVKIDNVIRFKDIDLHTGNVSLDGCIHIDGNVRSGMTVEATGSVIIKGAVHNAIIIAGEDIVVEEGIIGSKVSDVDCENNTARLTAGGDIQANFVNLAVLQAKGDIRINQYITHSDVIADGKVLVGEHDGKGQIIGGRTNAIGGLECKIIGAKSNVLTKITVGFPLSMKEEYKQLKLDQIDQMDKIIQKSNMLDKIKEKYIQTPSEANQAMVQEKEEEFNAMDEILTQTNLKIANIEQAISRYHESKIIAHTTVFEQTQFNINGAKKKFKETYPGGGHFASVDKRITQV